MQPSNSPNARSLFEAPRRGELVRPRQHLRVFRRVPRRAGFEHHHVDARLRQHVGGRAATRARSDDADVVCDGSFLICISVSAVKRSDRRNHIAEGPWGYGVHRSMGRTRNSRLRSDIYRPYRIYNRRRGISSRREPEVRRRVPRPAERAGRDTRLRAIPFDGRASPLAAPISTTAGMAAGNRWCILPMEGWDGTTDGHPSDLTRRRWTRFGQSGAKMIWGGEAVAVRHDGRANPNQLVINADTLSDLADLRQRLIEAHREQFGRTDDLLIGLQLTHSGRYARPTTSGPAPRVAYRHPVLDRRFGITDDRPVFTDDELDRLVEDFVAAAPPCARTLGFAVRRHQALPRLPRARAARRARSRPARTAAASRTACGS